MNNPVGWFEIYVQDMARARTFYEAVFSVQLTRLEGTEFEMWAFPMQPDGSGAPLLPRNAGVRTSGPPDLRTPGPPNTRAACLLAESPAPAT